MCKKLLEESQWSEGREAESSEGSGPLNLGQTSRRPKKLVVSGGTTQSSETCTSLPFSSFFRTFKIWYPQIAFLIIVDRPWIVLEINMFCLCDIGFLTDKLDGILL